MQIEGRIMRDNRPHWPGFLNPKSSTILMKFLRLLLTLGFASMLFAGAAQAGEGKSCSECSKKSQCDGGKKEDKKP